MDIVEIIVRFVAYWIILYIAISALLAVVGG